MKRNIGNESFLENRYKIDKLVLKNIGRGIPICGRALKFGNDYLTHYYWNYYNT